jgi:glucose dehydrogenase
MDWTTEGKCVTMSDSRRALPEILNKRPKVQEFAGGLMSKRLLHLSGLFLLVAIARAQGPAPLTRPQNAAGRDWPVYGGTAEGTRYSTLRQITRANVPALPGLQFDRTRGLSAGHFRVNPIVVSGICSPRRRAAADCADGATGALKWS